MWESGPMWLSHARGKKPHSDKTGDLNGSMQHLLTVFINAVYEADFVRGRQSKQSKALVRF
jgi:hypothetical protein